MRLLRIMRVVVGLVGVVALAGGIGACSGNKLLTSGNSVEPSGTGATGATGATVAAGSNGSNGVSNSGASAYAVASKKSTSSGFNPFAGSTGPDVGKRIVIANPTMERVLQKGPLAEMSLGRKDAPVVIIKYASLTCPYCRKFQAEVFPKLKRNYIDTGKVRFIIREFPIGRSSGNATIALRCVLAAKYFTLYGKLLAQQKTWVSQTVRLEAIHRVSQQVGLSRSQFDGCLKNQDMIAGLAWVKDNGRSLGVIGTPNFFIQNKLVKTFLTYEELSGRVEKLLRGPVASAVTPGN